MEFVNTHEDAFGNEIEVFRCSCGRTHSVYSGGDIAFCPCEFENEGQADITREAHDAEMILDKPPKQDDTKEYIEYLHGAIIALQNRVSALEQEGE